MIFADLTLSRRLECAEAQAGKEFAEARGRQAPESGAGWTECAGTIAIFDGPESPVTQTFGLGLFESISHGVLDTIEHFFRDRGAPVIHEVSPFADIATLDLLCNRGYRPVELSTVMLKPLGPFILRTDEPDSVRVAAPQDADLWTGLSAKAWAADFPEMEDGVRRFGSVGFARANTVNFLAEIDGSAGATGSLCLYQDVALFSGASTVPQFRRRGLQSALLTARMNYATGAGYRIAMMVTAVGSQSQRNAERAGFKIAYTRTKWQLRTRD